MAVDFFIPVTHSGKEFEYPAKLLQYGYSYKIEVEVDGAQILFEPDEERNWRAQLQPDQWELKDKMNVDLLIKIANRIDEILKSDTK